MTKRRLTPTKQELNALQAEIEKHVGQRSAINSGEWAEKAIGLKERAIAAHVRARAFESHLIYERGLPLCAAGNGYFLPATESEMNDYTARLMLRAQSIVRRAKQVRHNYYHITVKQTTLLKAIQ